MTLFVQNDPISGKNIRLNKLGDSKMNDASGNSLGMTKALFYILFLLMFVLLGLRFADSIYFTVKLAESITQA